MFLFACLIMVVSGASSHQITQHLLFRKINHTSPKPPQLSFGWFTDLNRHNCFCVHDLSKQIAAKRNLETYFSTDIIFKSSSQNAYLTNTCHWKTLHSLNRASWYIYVRKTNKMHTFLSNLFRLIYPRHVSNSCFFIIRRCSVQAFVLCQRLDSS